MRCSKWWASVVCVAAVVAAPAAASARSVTTTPKKLGAGQVAVATCGALTGLQPNFTIAGSTVTAVVFTGIPSTCNGGSLSVTATNASTSLGSGGPVTVAS